MSHEHYNALCIETNGNLVEATTRDVAWGGMKPMKDRNAVNQLLITQFIEYVQIYKGFETSYDQILQPQKRVIIKQLLDATMGRLIEVKHELIKNGANDIQFHEPFLKELELTPDDYKFAVPRFAKWERHNELRERSAKLAQIVSLLPPKPVAPDDSFGMSLGEAIQILQQHERLRQGRLRAMFMRTFQEQEARRQALIAKGMPNLTTEQAVVRIQAGWRGFKARQLTRQMRWEEEAFIHMRHESSQPSSLVDRAKIIEQNRREWGITNEQTYQKARVDIKQKVLNYEGPKLFEQMQTTIRNYIVKEKEDKGSFPDIPDEEDGGSRFIFFPENEGEEGAETESGAKDKKGKKDKKDKKEKKDKKDKKDKDKKKDKGGDEAESEGWTANPSSFVDQLATSSNEFSTMQQALPDPAQVYNADLIRAEKRTEVWDEVRIGVDQLMRTELNKMIKSLEKGGKKGKKGKGKKGKKDKKGKKGKKDKDPTSGRSIESLWEELVAEEIIIQPMDMKLADFVGDYNFLAHEKTKANPLSYEPGSFYEFNEALHTFGLLPLTSEYVHENVPHTKGILIVGGPHEAKKSILHAMANEIGATLFDLSLENLVGKYPGKKGNDLLFNMIGKVARAMQPAILMQRDAELGFMKKPPKGDKRDPKRLKKDLPKFMKSLAPGERIMFLGATDQPWVADMGMLNQVFTRFIRVPKLFYGSRRLLLKHFITVLGGDIEETELAALTLMANNYTVNDIKNVCRRVVTPQRLQRGKRIKADEVVIPLSRLEQVDEELEESLIKFLEKTPMGKQMTKLYRTDDDEGGDDKKKKKK